MKILIHVRDMKLTRLERAKVERRLILVLARYGTRIDRLKVGFVGPRGSVHARIAIEVRMKPRLVRAEHADTDLFVALEHGVQRAARSVARAIAREGWWDETGMTAWPLGIASR